MIEELRLLAPDEMRGARTMARCHRQLARRRLAQARRKPALPKRPAADAHGLAIERGLFVSMCVVFLIAVASDVLRVFGAH